VSNASLCECIDAFDLADPGAVVLETRRPTFVWTSECEAEYYQIDVRRMVNGKPRSYLKRWVEDWEIVGGTNLWTLDEDLASQAYTWRIRAYRVNGSRKNGKWSDYGPEFAVSVGAPTNVPTVASLFGGELDPEVVTDVEALVFSWTVCTNATAYGLAFQTLKNGKWVSHKSLSIEADEFTVNGDLVEWVKPIDFKWGSYRWHVRGENIDGDTEWPTDPEWAYFDANIAVPAGVVALVSPAAGSVEEHFMPLFTWAPVPNATKYYLRIEELKNTGKWSSKKKLWIDADDWTVVDDLLVWDSTLKLKQDKTYRWSVTAGNIAGQGAETSPAEFTVHVETPVTPIPVSPDAVVLDECHLVFFWTAVSNVTAYRIEIDQLKSNGKSWILAEKVDVESGEWIESGSRLAWVCEDTINVGSYRWRVRGENQGVDGDWSEYAVFDIVPMASPDAAAIEVAEDSRMPEYTWVSVDGATMYYMEIEYLKNDKWKLYRNVWVDDDVSAAEQGWTADDDGGMHSLTYRWRVRAWNDDGYGDWSDYAPEFTIDLGTPAGIAVALSPLEGVEVPTNRPTFTWTAVPDATGYFIKFRNNGKNVKLKQDGKTVSEAWCSGTNFTPEAGLNWGNYEWWVIAWNPDGFSEAGYSQAATFGYGLVDPIGPTGTVAAAASVTFTWDPVPETKKHKLRIYQDVNGSLQKIWYDNKVGGTNDFFTAEVELESGVNYEWWIRAYGENSKNKGDWIISGFTAE